MTPKNRGGRPRSERERQPITVYVEPTLRRRLKVYCAMSNEEMSDTIALALSAFLDERGVRDPGELIPKDSSPSQPVTESVTESERPKRARAKISEGAGSPQNASDRPIEGFASEVAVEPKPKKRATTT